MFSDRFVTLNMYYSLKQRTICEYVAATPLANVMANRGSIVMMNYSETIYNCLLAANNQKNVTPLL